MKHVVMFSGGSGSWGAAKRVVAEHGPAAVTLLFTDTLIEDEDTYRFLEDAALNLGSELVKIADGRTPWEVFRDVRFLGNNRVAPCSRVLKQEVARKWVEENCDPADTTLYVGIDWTEEHRLAGAQRGWEPWKVQAPLCAAPFIEKPALLALMAEEGLRPPRLYALGFPHNNCGGFCVRAGQAQFKRLLEVMPGRYAEHERQEDAMRELLAADVAIMRDRTGGELKPLPMREFRERIAASNTQFGFGDIDPFDWGGCGCFLDGEEAGGD